MCGRRGLIAGRLVRVLAVVAADPGCGLRRVEVLDAAERAQVLAGWNDTAAPVPAVTLPELFGRRRRGRRMRWRWCAGTRVVSYAGAGRAGEPAGAGAGGAGGGSGAVVAVLLDRSASWWWRCWRC